MSSELPAILGGEPVRGEGPPKWPLQDEAVQQAMEKAFVDGTWGKYHGGCCKQLQEALIEYLNVATVHLCCSGTVACELALRSVKVGADDEVIMAAYDFKSNFTNVITAGAVPVLVDLDPANWQLSVTKLEAAITPKTKAIIASHLHGGVIGISSVLEIAQRHHLALIEDACQATGAIVEGTQAGTGGDVGFYSFGGSKLLTSGRGGAVFSNRPEIMQRIKLSTHRGNDAYPLSELQAALLIPQLKMLKERNHQRTQSVATLDSLLKDESGIQLFSNDLYDSQPAYYKVGMQYDSQEFGGLTSTQFAQAMRAEGIAVDRGFRSLHRVHSRKRFRCIDDLPEATKADHQLLTLHHPLLLECEERLTQFLIALQKIRQYSAEIATLP